MLQNILYLWYNYEKTKINSTLQVLSLLILQATVHTASRQTMMCSSDESQLIRLLMQLLKAKKVIEIGKIHKCVSLCLYKGYQGVHQILYLFIYLQTSPRCLDESQSSRYSLWDTNIIVFTHKIHVLIYCKIFDSKYLQLP